MIENRKFVCKQCGCTECVLIAQYNGTFSEKPRRCPYKHALLPKALWIELMED